jgi:hypothetical protein
VSYIDADVGLSLNRYEYRRYKWWDYTGERIVEVVPFTTSRQPRMPPLYPEALIMHVQIESEPPCFKSRKQKKKITWKLLSYLQFYFLAIMAELTQMVSGLSL